MKINSRQIVKKIKADAEQARRRRISLYVHSKTADAFMRACKREKLSASIVVEKMMQEFVSPLE